MKKILLRKLNHLNTSNGCLYHYGKNISALLREYLNSGCQVIKVRGKISDGVDQHLSINLKHPEADIHIDLATDSDGDDCFIIDTENLDACVSEENNTDLLMPLIQPYLTPSEKDLLILLEQEEQLQYSSFSSEDAFKLIQTIKEICRDPLAVNIVRESDQTVIARYVDNLKSDRNIFFAEGKRRMSLISGHSSLFAYCKNMIDNSYSEYKAQAPEYICGAGAFPIRVNGELIATIAISGLKDGKDHDVIVSALNLLLNKNVIENPSLII